MATHTHSTTAILSIGDELTLGQKLDTNAQWLSSQLSSRGVVPRVHITLADGLVDLTERIKVLAQTHDLVVMTGGLGPTADDLTRLAMADAMGDELVEDAEALAALINRFERAGRTMAEANKVQALRPVNAQCLPNPMGTAPGLHATIGNCDVYCLPGPPRENRPMFENHLLPNLRPERLVLTRVLPTVGVGESTVADLLGDLMSRDRNPLVGTTASSSIVSVRMRYEGSDETEGQRLLAETEAEVRRIIGEHIFANQDQSLAKTVVELMIEQDKTLATVESCTGGMIGQEITDIHGSSAAYVGGFVTYTNQMKVEQVGVSQHSLNEHGAVSRDVCLEMALGGKERSGADYSVSVTGIAGPGGGTEDKPVGTVWIGLVGPDGNVDVRRFMFAGNRSLIRSRSATMALAMLWGMLARKPKIELFWESAD